jgi:hypothetical protein
MVRTRGESGGGVTRGDTAFSQGKLEVNGRRTPKGLAGKRRKRRRRRMRQKTG